MIPVVYSFKQSGWGEEIRYSLRSLAMHLREDFAVWIIGDRCDWMRGVNHIPYVTRSGIPPQCNINNAFKMACSMFDRFLWISDDHYLLKDMCLSDFQDNWFLENLDEVKARGSGDWEKLLWATYDRLKELGYPGYNAELHIPKLIDSAKAKRLFSMFDFLGGKHLPKTAYFNVCLEPGIFPVKFINKIGFYSVSQKVASQDWDNAWFLNHDDAGLSEELKNKIQELFPEPSDFEWCFKYQVQNFLNMYRR